MCVCECVCVKVFRFLVMPCVPCLMLGCLEFHERRILTLLSLRSPPPSLSLSFLLILPLHTSAVLCRLASSHTVCSLRASVSCPFLHTDHIWSEHHQYLNICPQALQYIRHTYTEKVSPRVSVGLAEISLSATCFSMKSPRA